ncbi:MBOAT family O-acyltransferase [Hominifimenecus sp. rT4P-3]|uniref:MBOAT family O-acyltransferase n=1 Tax=Hominifimenecus sp. rT4P-3 TaxID=3242979 RepID=UPI003DA3F0B0
MSFVSTNFLIFLFAAVAGYYLIPKKAQWMWLLLFSYLFYLSAGIEILFYLVFATLVTYGAGIGIEKTEKKKRVMLAAVLLDFGMLAFVKYFNFAVENLNALFGLGIAERNLLLPLGISFYTFQSVGYVIDVYRGKVKAEKNPFRFALFVSFFPQLLQGPIGRFDRLAGELYAQRSFSLLRMERGLQRMLWGYFKKMVLADRLSVTVNLIFSNYQQYSGWINVIGVLCYSIQLYADFSGGMDVVIGVAEMFGISMDENFKRPYFSRSISEFWHRWHITLGTWMKDYIFYPLSLSRGMKKFEKFAKKKFGKKTGRILPVCIANIVIFLVVGIWHGPAWKYICYGLFNGVIIAFSNLMAPAYKKGLAALHVPVQSWWWKGFQMLRTFVIVNISWFFDMGIDVKAALTMMRTTFQNVSLQPFRDGTLTCLGLDRENIVVVLFGCLIVFVVSVLQERGVKIRESLSEKNWLLRWIVYGLLVLALPLLGETGPIGGFIYAQF